MTFTHGMKVEHILTHKEGIIYKGPYTCGRRGGRDTVEYVEVRVGNNQTRTWNTENVRVAK